MPNANTYSGYHYPSVYEESGPSLEDIKRRLNTRTWAAWYTSEYTKYNVVRTYVYQPSVQHVEEVEINDG